MYSNSRTSGVATGGVEQPLCGKCDVIFCPNIHKNALFLLNNCKNGQPLDVPPPEPRQKHHWKLLATHWVEQWIHIQ